MSKMKNLAIDQLNMVKQRPILFSTPMVQAIMAGRKTMTRRIVKYSKNIENPQVGFSIFSEKGEFEVRGVHESGEYGISFFKKPFNKGDILWVRESWAYKGSTKDIAYKANADARVLPLMGKWKPSIHMPKAACRIFLEITNIRVERLQSITEDDAKSEGVEISKSGHRYFNYTPKHEYFTQFLYDCNSAIHSFKTLWQSINGSQSWQSNPWVWVIEFKLIEKPNNF